MGVASGQAGREDRRAVRVIAKGGGRERAATACVRWPWAERPGARHGDRSVLCRVPQVPAVTLGSNKILKDR
jgi:hypothetical protein